MSSKWHEKKARQAEIAFERALQNAPERAVENISVLVSAVAMGGGDEKVFEKKLTKEEKKAAAKAKREAKRKTNAKGGDGDDGDDDDEDATNNKLSSAKEVLDKTKDSLAAADQQAAAGANDGIDHEASDALAAAGTICTFSASREGVDARARDINVTNFTLQHMGSVLLDETEVVLNHGNRYGLIGSNGCGKSTLLKALGARAIPIPNFIDIFFLKEEIEPSDTITALDAVMNVDEERLRLEVQAEELNQLFGDLADNPPDPEDEDAKSPEEIQEEVMDALNMVYERLDALDASTAEVRARSILSGLGFTHEMQSKKTKDFSGGWRMRVSLARALFIQPVWYVPKTNQPTNRCPMCSTCQCHFNIIPQSLISYRSIPQQSLARRADQSLGYGSCHLGRRLLVEMESNPPLGIPFARFSQQCLYTHDPFHRPQKVGLLRWKL
jgi:ATP-binding cassette subfamily F protein 2